MASPGSSGGALFRSGFTGHNSIVDLAEARTRLTELILTRTLPPQEVEQRGRAIHRTVLETSPYLRIPDFRQIHPTDLDLLFRAYEQRFFEGLCDATLAGRALAFRLAPRLTRAGGRTARFRSRAGEESFEIAVATTILFDSFGQPGREVTACGLPCADRLEALQRVMEHELVHLAEMLCWGVSNCAAPRFQGITARLFGHRAHTHNLITRRERAAGAGIVRGTRVAFTFEGQRFVGRVNRITQRATVLVEDPDGTPYSDGGRYRKYYVPLAALEVVRAARA